MAQISTNRMQKTYSPGVLIGNWSEDRYRVMILNYYF